MKRKHILFMILSIFMFIRVNAAACTLEDQVKVNNEAGAVTVSASPFEYTYTDEDTESGETFNAIDYLGMVYIYNLTPDIYAVVSSGSSKTNVYYDEENPSVSSYISGGMASVKNYKISIYPTNTNCGKTAIRELNVTVPRLNRYYSYDSCSNYPDYFYCSQFMTSDDIAEEDFVKGITEYAKTHKSANDETRKEGFLEETTNFVKKHWLIIILVILVIGGSIGTFIYIRNKKRKEQIV